MKDTSFVLLAFVSIVIYLIFLTTRTSVALPYYKLKKKSAERTMEAIKILKKEAMLRGRNNCSVAHPLARCLIGFEDSPITTEKGFLPSKITALNPNLSAVVVSLLKKANVKRGDKVCLGITGSFPILNVSAIIAVETIGAVPIIITSVGTSSWGANDPLWTYLDMEKVLYDKGIIRHKSIAASIGGKGDRGDGLSKNGLRLIKSAIERNGVFFIPPDGIRRSIRKRMKIYKKYGKKIKVYINIGGGAASMGPRETRYKLHSGINRNKRFRNELPYKGVAVLFLEKGIPVIHLLNMREIADKYDIPYNPVNIPKIGKGKIFTKQKYPLFTTILLFLILVAIIIYAPVAGKNYERRQ